MEFSLCCSSSSLQILSTKITCARLFRIRIRSKEFIKCAHMSCDIYLHFIWEREKLEAEQQQTGKDSLREIEYLSVRPLRCEETRRHRRKIQFYCTKNISLDGLLNSLSAWFHTHTRTLEKLSIRSSEDYVSLSSLFQYSTYDIMIKSHPNFCRWLFTHRNRQQSTQSRARGVCCCLTV